MSVSRTTKSAATLSIARKFYTFGFSLAAFYLLIAVLAPSSEAQRIIETRLTGAAQTILAPLVGDFTDFSAAANVLGQPDFTTVSPGTAGTPSAKFNGAYGVAVDQTTGKVFVADFSNNRVLRFASASAMTNGAPAEIVLGQPDFATISVGTTENKMNRPIDVFVDSVGRLWVCEISNNRILRFDSASTIISGANADAVLGQTGFNTSATGAALSQMNGLRGVFADAGGRLWVADGANNRVLRFDNAAAKAASANADAVFGQPDFTTAIAATTQSTMRNPLGVTTDANNRLYVSDSNNNRVLIFNNAGAAANGAPAAHVLGQPDFMTNTQNNGGISAKSLFGPRHLFFNEATSSLFVSDFSNNRVLRFAATAAPTAATVTISGRALTATGRGIRNVLIRLTDGEGHTRSATTTAFGYYRFTDVNAGETVIITTKGKRFQFSQPTQVLNVNDDTAEVNFIANP